jgi:hypothetical protein
LLISSGVGLLSMAAMDREFRESLLKVSFACLLGPVVVVLRLVWPLWLKLPTARVRTVSREGLDWWVSQWKPRIRVVIWGRYGVVFFSDKKSSGGVVSTPTTTEKDN